MVNSVKGFTLIELMVTLAVMSILLMAGVPLTQGWINSAHQRDAASVIQQGIARAKAMALRNPAGVIGSDKPAALLCRNDSTLVLAQPASNQNAFNCSQVGSAQIVWSSALPKQVTVESDDKAFQCVALDNRALPFQSSQAGLNCATVDLAVKAGREDALPISII
jgi:prepilin-type N-terminal cleavage/methylation domain-containing protein